MRATPLILATSIACALCLPGSGTSAAPLAHFPWREAGLTEREAAAHLLNRFSYGPRPGEIDQVLKIGLERWFERQLAGPPALSRPVGRLLVQKLWRATAAENQLTEVMTDFWFNHFNVSLTDRQARGYVLSYEWDAIRPNSLGAFRDLLGATARHPAMLLYLDNAQSAAPDGAVTLLELERRGFGGFAGRRMRPHGLNENYARELLELHTLGVDGGYTQDDVIQVARAFTGWSLLPPGERRREAEERLRRVRRAGGLGFVVDGEFLFRADQHDAGAKVVLGTKLPAGRGREDGEAVLDLLARHPATARHIAHKLAVRFVSDTPPQALDERLAGVFLKSGGDTREMLRALAASPEFWSRAAVGAKIKSPFELAISALRITGSRPGDPRELLDWITRMGQPLYACQSPAGYPDRGEAWINTGSLLQRMNFALEIARRAGNEPEAWARLLGSPEFQRR